MKGFVFALICMVALFGLLAVQAHACPPVAVQSFSFVQPQAVVVQQAASHQVAVQSYAVPTVVQSFAVTPFAVVTPQVIVQNNVIRQRAVRQRSFSLSIQRSRSF